MRGIQAELKLRVAAVLVLAIAVAPRSFAGKHPVPLEAKTDDAACVQCHEDKSKGKVVHPAVGMGCLTCHVVRINSPEDTRIGIKAGRTANLCFQCHADKKIEAPVRVHAPAVSDCLKCHDPHVSPNEKLLRKEQTGGKTENLCLTCHSQGLNTTKEGSRHAALDMGCSSCHATHKTGERTKAEFRFHLIKEAPALCQDCHDVKEQKLAAAHQNQPFAGANCLTCHDPHDSKSPKLMRAFQHSPFEGKACDSCHQPAKDGKVVLVQSEAKAVCASCHEETAKKINSAAVAHPGAQGDCTSCHDPHAGKSPRFLKPDPVTACTACHENQATALAKKSTLHDPVFMQKCSICHEPHGGTRPRLLRSDVEDLCIQCHAPQAKALTAQDGSAEYLFGKSVTLPPGYVAKSPKITLVGRTSGHPMQSHPVAGQDPRDKSKKITCLSCHDPHAGEAKSMLSSAGGSPRALCSSCHEERK